MDIILSWIGAIGSIVTVLSVIFGYWKLNQRVGNLEDKQEESNQVLQGVQKNMGLSLKCTKLITETLKDITSPRNE